MSDDFLPKRVNKLFGNADETNPQLVARPSRNRAQKGQRKVRGIGVGHEKGQITATILAFDESSMELMGRSKLKVT